MAKQLNVSLAFTADTGKARAQIQDLQRSLEQLMQGTKASDSMFITRDLKEAQQAAAQLQVSLQSALNPKTGALDLTKFSDSLKSSGTNLRELQSKLNAMGPAGEQAFAKLAQSITLAEIPLKRTSKLIDEFKVSLMNTARWQLSSSVLHGFMGTIQGAIGYAQDLNQSLNNIRIVTGASTTEMAAFAEQANKAAQALNTRTTDYTDAALIYYQQGIRDQDEIADRVETTIKLANVSRQSAEEVSDQLTAIWNNFYDGTQSLEYYADVITALGAATASSSEEISTGVEKFAAVAETVGMSYEYATAALATITATTRQSADTVGTGLRTLFSRLQSLKLGETLEDGVGLTKYSAALESVGVEILDINGNIKDMDVILDDLGAKWQNISKEQQIALAQTVGGVRQYTNLIALMDNWDFMKENLEVARNSEGTLQKQADIYAESWEAAQKRVKAAAEGIYQSLLNDEFFINMNNGFAGLLGTIDKFIDNIGGLKGVLISVGAIATNIFQKEIAQGLSNMAYSLQMLTKRGRDKALQTKVEANQLMIENAQDKTSIAGNAQGELYKAQAEAQISYIQNAQRMSEAEQAINQSLLERNSLLVKEVSQEAEATQQAVKHANALKVMMAGRAQKSGNQDFVDTVKGLENAIQKQQELAVGFENISRAGESLQLIPKGNIEEMSQAVEKFKADLEASGYTIEELKNKGGAFEEIGNILEEIANGDVETLKNKFGELSPAIESLGSTLISFDQPIENLIQKFTEQATQAGVSETAIQNYLNAIQNGAQSEEELKVKLAQATSAMKQQADAMQNAKTAAISMSAAISKAASALMTTAMIIQQIKGLFEIWSDDSASFGEKFLQTLMTIGMVAPSAIGMLAPLLQGATVSMAGFGAATTAATIPLLAIVGPIMAVAAAIGVIGIAISNYESESKKAEKRLEEATKEANNAENAFKQAKTEWQNINSDFDQYSTMVTALSELTAGTSAWKEQMALVAQKTDELLEKYPELANYKKIVDQDTGELYYNPEDVKAVQDQYNQNYRTAMVYKSIAGINQAQAQYDKDTIDFTAKNTGYGYEELEYLDQEIEWAKEDVSDYSQLVQELNESIAEENAARQEAVAQEKSRLQELKQSKEYERSELYKDIGNFKLFDDGSSLGLSNKSILQLSKSAAAKDRSDFLDAAIQLLNAVDSLGKANLDKLGITDEDISNILNEGNIDALWDTMKLFGTISDVKFTNNTFDISKAQQLQSMLTYLNELNSEIPSIDPSSASKVGEKYLEWARQDEEQLEEAEKYLATSQAELQKLQDDKSELNSKALELKETLNESVFQASQDAVKALLEDKDIYKNSTDKNKLLNDAINYFSESMLDHWKQAAVESLGENDEELKLMAKKYLNIFQDVAFKNITDLEVDSDGNVSYKIIDENGEKSDKETLSFQQLTDLWASQRAATQFDVDFEKNYIQALNNLGEGIKEASEKISKESEKVHSGGLQDKKGESIKYTEEEMQSVTNFLQMIAQSSNGMKDIDFETLNSIIGNDKLYNLLTSIGNDFLEPFGISTEQIKSQAEELKANMKASPIKDIMGDSFGALNDSLRASLESVYSEMSIGPMGQEAGRKFLEGLSKAFEAVGQDKTQFQGILNKILGEGVLGTENAEQKIRNILSEVGIDLSENSAAWDEWIQSIIDAYGSIPDFSSLKQNIIDLTSILGSLNYGDTIKSKDYDKLIAIDPNLADSFQTLADDTYRYLGTLEQAKNIEDQILGDKIEQLKTINDIISAENANVDQFKSDLLKANTGSTDENLNAQNILDTINNDSTLSRLTNEVLGYNKERFKEIAQHLQDGSQQGINEVAMLYQQLMDLLNSNAAELSQEIEEMTASQAEDFFELKSLKDNNQIGDEAYQQQGQYLANQMIQAAASLDELKQSILNIEQAGFEVSGNIIGQQLAEIASNYDICKQEIEEYNEALRSGNEAAIQNAQVNLETSLAAAEAAQAHGLDAQELEELSKIMLETNEELSKGKDMLESNGEAAVDAAVRYKRLDEGIADLYDNFDDYEKALRDVQDAQSDLDKAMAMNTKTMTNFKKSLANILDTSEDLIDTNLIDALDPDTLEKAAMGDADAIRELQNAFIDAQYEAANLGSEADALKDYLNGLSDGAVIDIDNAPALEKFVQTMLEAGATADEIEAALGGMGIDCDVTPFEGAMGELTQSAIDAANSTMQSGDAIVGNMSFDATTNELQAESIDTQEDTAFQESVTMTPVPGHVKVPEGDGSTPVEYDTTVPQYTKTVNPITTSEEDLKQQSVQAVKLSNAHKSAGGNVSQNRQTGQSPRGGGGKGCFVAGTLVATLYGFKNIEDIQKDDIVLSYNEKTKKNEYSVVEQTMIHYIKDDIYTLYIEDEKLAVTGIHRFLINRQNILGWIPASELKFNDLVMFSDYTWHKIKQIDIEHQIRTVYNFEVSNNHNYYVGKNHILAHNKGGGCFIAGTFISMPNDKYENIENIRIGDIVLSYNEQFKKNEYSEVVQTMIHFVKENIYTLHIENETLTATGIHRFYIARGFSHQWIPAEELQVGDLVLFADGTWHTIDKIDIQFKFETVYNFEVSNNHNYYVGKNRILAHNKGGGGGGKAKTPSKKDTKKSSDEIERYHVVKAQLDDLTDKYDRISKAKDRAFGPQRVKQLNKEIVAQKQLNDKQKEYIKEIQKWLAIDKQNISKYGAEFDKNGNITNYEQLMQSQLDKYNDVINKYNSMTAEEQESDETKKMLEDAEKAYEEFKKYLEKYEETVELLEEQEEALRDGLQAAYDLVTERNEYVIEFRLEYDESMLEWFDYLNHKVDVFNDGLDGAAEKLGNLNKKLGTLKDTSDTNRSGITNTLEHFLNDGFYYDDNKNKINISDKVKDPDAFIKRFMNNELTKEDKEILSHMSEDEWKKINEYKDNLLDVNQQIIDMADEVVDIISDAFNEIIHRLERAMLPIERATKVLEHYGNIVDIVGRDVLGVSTQLMEELDHAQSTVAKYNVEAAKTNLDTLIAAKAETERLLLQAEEQQNDEMIKKWKKVLEEQEDAIMDAEDKLREALISALEAIRKEYEDKVNNSVDKMLDNFAGQAKGDGIMNSWKALTDQIEYAKEAAERYVPEYREIYELSKLNRDINKSIDDTDNIKNKKALRDLQKEINKLQEHSGEISEYDLENARRRYELELAKLQLEESSSIKDTVRLSKDSEGNWSYIYTANEEDVAAAEQNYEDKLYAMQQANAEYINSLQDQITQAEQEYADKVREIMLDTSLTEEQRQQLMQIAAENFNERVAYIKGETEKVLQNNTDLYEKEWTWYADFTQKRAGLDEEDAQLFAERNVYRLGSADNFVMGFNQTMYGMYTGVDTMDQYAQQMTASMQTMVTEVNGYLGDYKTDVEEAIAASGIAFGEGEDAAADFATAMQQEMGKAVEEAGKAKDSIEEVGRAAVEEFAGVITQAETWQTKYKEIMDTIIAENELVVTSINGVNNALSKFKEDQIGKDDTQMPNENSGGGKPTNSGGGNNSGGGSAKRGDLLDYTFTGNAPNRSYYAAGKLVGTSSNYTNEAKAIQALINAGIWGKNYSQGSWIPLRGDTRTADEIFKQYGFESGGYTGSWNGNDGKMAFLHEKELVLNKEDTSNILNAVDMVRKLSSVIDLSAKAAEFSIGNLSAQGSMNTMNSQLEQTVTITAEFPNVTDKNEIAEALDMLINESAQYANRKNL